MEDVCLCTPRYARQSGERADAGRDGAADVVVCQVQIPTHASERGSHHKQRTARVLMTAAESDFCLHEFGQHVAVRPHWHCKSDGCASVVRSMSMPDSEVCCLLDSCGGAVTGTSNAEPITGARITD